MQLLKRNFPTQCTKWGSHMAQKQDTTHVSEDDASWRNVRMRFPETDAIVERFLETQGARGISLAMRQLIYLFVAEYGDVEVATVIGLKLVESLQAGAEGSDLFAQLAAGVADVDAVTTRKKAPQQTAPPSTTTRAPDQVNEFVAEAKSQPVEESVVEAKVPKQQVAPQPAQKPEQKPEQESAQPAQSEPDDGFDMDDVMGQAFGR